MWVEPHPMAASTGFCACRGTSSTNVSTHELLPTVTSQRVGGGKWWRTDVVGPCPRPLMELCPWPGPSTWQPAVWPLAVGGVSEPPHHPAARWAGGWRKASRIESPPHWAREKTGGLAGSV